MAISDYLQGYANQMLNLHHGDSGAQDEPVMIIESGDERVPLYSAVVHAPTNQLEIDEARQEVEQMETLTVFIDSHELVKHGITKFRYKAKITLRDYGDGWTTDFDTCKWTRGNVVWGLKKRPLINRGEMKVSG